MTIDFSSDRLLLMVNSAWFLVLSDLFVNLSAGWFGAALIVPNFSDKKWPLNFALLTGNLLAGIVFLIIAFKLRVLL